MLTAHYADGLNAASRPVTVQVFADELRIRDEGGRVLAVWPLADVLPPCPLPRNAREEPLVLRFHPAGRPSSDAVADPKSRGRLTFTDPAMADRMRAVLAPRLREGRARRFRRWLAAVAIIWLAVGLVWVGSPHLARYVASFVPRTWEASLGEQTRRQLGRLLSDVREDRAWVELDGEARIVMDALMRRLDGVPAEEDPLRVHILDSPVVNAFAVPGNSIVVTTGLLEEIEELDELAAVLAHERAHVRLRHATQQMLRGMALQYLTGVMGGGGSRAGARAAHILATMGWSRDMEREADELGLRTLRQARISPRGFLRFFRRLERKSGTVADSSAGSDRPLDRMASMLSTHPGFRERIEQAESVDPYPEDPLYGEDFWKRTMLRGKDRQRELTSWPDTARGRPRHQ